MSGYEITPEHVYRFEDRTYRSIGTLVTSVTDRMMANVWKRIDDPELIHPMDRAGFNYSNYEGKKYQAAMDDHNKCQSFHSARVKSFRVRTRRRVLKVLKKAFA